MQLFVKGLKFINKLSVAMPYIRYGLLRLYLIIGVIHWLEVVIHQIFNYVYISVL